MKAGGARMRAGGSVLGANGALPEGHEKRHAVEAMFDRVAPGYDRMNRVISLGQDRRWRRRTVTSLELGAGARVLDLACGTGDLCRDLAADGLAPVGIDVSMGMLAAARTDAARSTVTRATRLTGRLQAAVPPPP